MSNERAAADSDPNYPYQRLQIARNPEGSITRLFKCPDAPPSSDPKLPTPVLSKDIPINQSNNTWLRFFLPRHVLEYWTKRSKPHQLISFLSSFFTMVEASYYLAQPQQFSMHDFCFNFATDVPVIIASVDYRLAREHRLPAAYDDAVEALHWIKTSQDD